MIIIRMLGKFIFIILLVIIAALLIAFLGCCIKAFWICVIGKKKRSKNDRYSRLR